MLSWLVVLLLMLAGCSQDWSAEERDGGSQSAEEQAQGVTARHVLMAGNGGIIDTSWLAADGYKSFVRCVSDGI